nr:NUDIX hydrolase [Angustibacter aerolatus]
MTSRAATRGSCTVRAAGVLPWRRAGDGIEVAVVHRPKYDDWSWPKGKLDDGEPWTAAAVRECLEETGLRVVLGVPLPDASYDVGGAAGTRHKVVRYWAAQVLQQEADLVHEVDEVRWLPPHEAGALLDYRRDLQQPAGPGVAGRGRPARDLAAGRRAARDVGAAQGLEARRRPATARRARPAPSRRPRAAARCLRLHPGGRLVVGALRRHGRAVRHHHRHPAAPAARAQRGGPRRPPAPRGADGRAAARPRRTGRPLLAPAGAAGGPRRARRPGARHARRRPPARVGEARPGQGRGAGRARARPRRGGAGRGRRAARAGLTRAPPRARVRASRRGRGR